jgi:hypothetical protein
VAVFTRDGNMHTTATAAVTFGGVTLSSLGSVYNNNTTGSGFLWVFGGAGIPSGTQTVSVEFTQSGGSWTGYISSFTYLNVAAVGSLQTAFGDSAGPAVSVTPPSASPGLLWGANSYNGWQPLNSFSLTNRQSVINNNNTPDYVAGDIGVSGTTAINITSGWPASNPWAAAGLVLQ